MSFKATITSTELESTISKDDADTNDQNRSNIAYYGPLLQQLHQQKKKN